MSNFIIKFITTIAILDIIFVLIMIRYAKRKGEW